MKRACTIDYVPRRGVPGLFAADVRGAIQQVRKVAGIDRLAGFWIDEARKGARKAAREVLFGHPLDLRSVKP